MKEFIEYNYNIDIENLNSSVECHFFMYNNEFFLFCLFKRNIKDIDDLVSCVDDLKNLNLFTYNFIKNKDSEFLTKVDDQYYVMVKIFKNYNEIIDITDMVELQKKTLVGKSLIKNYKNNWSELWSSKVDYFEYQVSELGFGKNIVIDSFGYFVGLAENAIAMVNKANNDFSNQDNIFVSLTHRRVFYPNYYLNFFNPISYIIDLAVRDAAEYIKSVFYAGDDAILELSTYLKSSKLTGYSYQMLYARLVFPSIYFDLYENAISDSSNEESIINIINVASEYEFFLKNAYDLICKYYKIEGITWINNN